MEKDPGEDLGIRMEWMKKEMGGTQASSQGGVPWVGSAFRWVSPPTCLLTLA